MEKKLSEKQIRRLVEALKASGYYFGEIEEKRAMMNFKFIEALQIFFLDSKGKDVRRVINAFRAVSRDCQEVLRSGQNFVDQKVREAVLRVLKRNLKPKKFKEAEGILVYKPKPLESSKTGAFAAFQEMNKRSSGGSHIIEYLEAFEERRVRKNPC